MNKIEVKLIGENGNIFNLIGITMREMSKYGLKQEAQEMKERVFSCGSYNEALNIIMEYVDVV